MPENNVNFMLYLGILCGALLGALILYVHRKKESESRNQLDERQQEIKGSVAIHTLIFAGFLLIISGMASEAFPNYIINIGSQNILLIVLILFFYLMESILRGAYFGRNYQAKNIRVFGILAVLYWIIPIFHIFNIALGPGRLLNSTGHLSTESIFTFIFLWLAIFLQSLS